MTGQRKTAMMLAVSLAMDCSTSLDTLMPRLEARRCPPDYPFRRDPVRLSTLFAEETQVGAPGPRSFCGRFQGLFAVAFGCIVCRMLTGFPYGIDYRRQLIAGGDAGLAVKVQADDFPSQRHRQAVGMGVAQVVAMGFGVRCQGPQHRRGIGIYVGEGGCSRLSAR